MNNPKKVNLSIIGTMTSVTSFLHAYLDEHPDICMISEKESGCLMGQFTWAKGEDRYLCLFNQAVNPRIFGKSGTHSLVVREYNRDDRPDMSSIRF
jgi:hypothetical protein